MTQADTAAALPDRLGDFEVEHELGRGGSGVVYAARHGAQEVALKVLRNEDVASPRDRARFLDEARHLAKLSHPGVVRVLAVGELPDGRPYLAMERLRGTSLAERLIMRRFSPEQALVLFEQLAAAVSALHGAGLVHRDIKPENVMLVDGERRVVLLDLGIARGIDDIPSTTTQAGLQRGTPAYMAPERFFGARATVSSDVYETAVVLYVMMTGDLPWKDPRSAKERMEPRPLGSLGVKVPAELEAAVMAALGPEPIHRPATIEALVASVRRAGWEGETTAAAPVAGAEKKSRGVLVGLGMTAAFVGAAVVALMVMQKKHDKVPPQETPIASASPVITPIAVAPPDAAPPDATPPDATPVMVDAAPAPAKKPKKTKPKATASSSKVDGDCGTLAELYCTDDFLATEGGLAGVLCKTMRKNAADWAAIPEQQQWCRDNYDTMAAAVKERLRQFDEGLGPPR